ncbi:cysteine--tRNA ligase [Candidatus Micrarchaeota archaeon]|nr:cysteine--tRNA ligase [Candidatus Micrarchaeota archaeon]
MVRVYNTLSKKVEELRPQEGRGLKVYVCGLTTYDYAHMGHARTYVAFDIIRRHLMRAGFEIKFVQNVTDIDDKILKRALERKEEPLALSARFDALAREDLKALNVLPADVCPKVSETLRQIVAMVQILVQRRFAYETEDGFYFEVAKFAGYGKLSGQKLGEIKSGARVAVDEKKKAPEDFAIWKFAAGDECGFEDAWSVGEGKKPLRRGRPGWHIECSAMAKEHLGETVDVHGGARDLIFPHHENEIAQSEAANGKQFVKCWMHTGFLTVNGEKMAKSLGNFVTIRDALKKFDANSIRMFFAAVHYRSPVDYSEKSIVAAKNTLEKIFAVIGKAKGAMAASSGSGAEKNTLSNAHGMGNVEPGEGASGIALGARKALAEFEAAMDNDFDTPNACAAMVALSKEMGEAIANGKTAGMKNALNAMLGMLDVFGIDYSNVKEQHQIGAGVGGFVLPAVADVEKMLAKIKGGAKDEDINWLLRVRNAARGEKDYALSDRIRRELVDAGIEVEDAKGAAGWKRK